MTKLQKVVTIGPPGIGKTCLIHAICERKFTEISQPTQAVDLYNSSRTLQNGQIVTNTYWDTAGQETFASVTKNYLRDAQVVLLVVSPLDLSVLPIYYKQITETLTQNTYHLIVVFSKMDIVILTEEQREAALNRVKEYNPKHILFTSSKTLYNIEQLDSIISSCALEDPNPLKEVQSQRVNIYQVITNKYQECCKI